MSPFSSYRVSTFQNQNQVSSEVLGFQSLENRNLLQEQIRKNMALENRIRRLAFEQQRAQKLTDIATEKASKLLDARDRHVKQVEERLKLQE